MDVLIKNFIKLALSAAKKRFFGEKISVQFEFLTDKNYRELTEIIAP
jgi:hypothetical protein